MQGEDAEMEEEEEEDDQDPGAEQERKGRNKETTAQQGEHCARFMSPGPCSHAGDRRHPAWHLMVMQGASC